MSKTRQSITGYIGPMFAYKTLLMLHHIGSAEAVGQKVLVIKPSIDTRYPATEVRSRNGGYHPATAVPINQPNTIFRLIKSNKSKIDLIAFDEIQFFNPKISDVVKTIAENGIEVVFCGLNRDYRGNPFPTMEKVIPLATKLQTTTALCMFPVGSKRRCGIEAPMTQRLLNGRPDSYNSPTVIIEQPGLSITYEARCLDHWFVPDLPVKIQL
jgi:thymidine kinase